MRIATTLVILFALVPAVVFPFPGPDATGVTTGCEDGVDRALIQDILQSPGSYFVNLHPPTGGTDVTGFLSK